MKWFGEPWPSPERRAPVCEDDADRIDVPVGKPCERCQRVFEPADRGVAIPFVTRGLDWGTAQVQETYHHAKCFLATVLGDASAEQIMGNK